MNCYEPPTQTAGRADVPNLNRKSTTFRVSDRISLFPHCTFHLLFFCAMTLIPSSTPFFPPSKMPSSSVLYRGWSAASCPGGCAPNVNHPSSSHHCACPLFLHGHVSVCPLRVCLIRAIIFLGHGVCTLVHLFPVWPRVDT